MLDLMFFLTENVENPRHIGSVLVFRKPRGRRGRVVQEIVDAYRRATPRPPFNRIPLFRKTGLPQWQEVDRIDVSHHVHHLALPSPGSDQQLHELIADLHAPMLERHRPGWKVYFIDGLAGDRFAVYHKCHHALVDGESGMAILRRAMTDRAADRRILTTIGLDHPERPRPAPEGLQKALEREARTLARRTYSIGVGGLHLIEQTFEGLRGYTPQRKRAFTAPVTPMNAPISSSRSVTHGVLPLRRLKTVARRAGATLNDVVLCVLDAAVNRYLREHGCPPDHPLVAICPVSLREAGVKEATTNVSAIWPPLGPVSAPVDARLRTIVANTREAKAELRSLGKGVAYAYAVMAFALTETLAVSRPEIFGLRTGNLLVSNVRGPEKPLYLNGARLEAMFPVSTLIVGVGLNVTFMSYADQVVLGYTGNGIALPGFEQLARYTVEAFDALEQRMQRQPKPAISAAGRPVARSARRPSPRSTAVRAR